MMGLDGRTVLTEDDPITVTVEESLFDGPRGRFQVSVANAVSWSAPTHWYSPAEARAYAEALIASADEADKRQEELAAEEAWFDRVLGKVSDDA